MYFWNELVKFNDPDAVEQFKDMFGDMFGVDIMKDADASVENTEDNKSQIRMETPGVKKEDIDITYDQNVLTVTYDKGSTKFKKRFGLKESVYDVKNIVTSYVDGLLTITVPRIVKEKSEPIKITL